MTPIPSAVEHEWQSVAGIICGGAQTLMECRAAGLSEDHYHCEPVRLAFRVVARLLGEHAGIDKVALRRELRREWEKEGVLPADSMTADSTIDSLYQMVWISSTALFHSRKVTEYAVLSEAQSALLNFAERAGDWEDGAESYLAEAQRALFGIAQIQKTGDDRFSALVPERWSQLCKEYEAGKTLRGIPSGFPSLDRMTRGYGPGDFIVIVGETGSGKSALAGNMAKRMAQDQPGHIYSLEMAWTELVDRHLFSDAHVSYERFQDRICTQEELDRLAAAAARLARLPVRVKDKGGMTIQEIIASIRYGVHQKECAWAVIDYTQLVEFGPGDKSTREMNREREVAYIARSLKALAMQCKIPIIALSQLNDDGKVRESRAIKHEADLLAKLVILDPDNQPTHDADTGTQAENRRYQLVVEKNRRGPCGKIQLSFIPSQISFVEEFTDGPH